MPLCRSRISFTMNKVIGFQITANNDEQLNGFYADTFGWNIKPGPHEHVSSIDTGNDTIEGSIIGRGDHIPDYVSLFIESEDIPATIETCLSNGAQLIRPEFTLDNGDRLGIVADPEGHIITLLNRRREETCAR